MPKYTVTTKAELKEYLATEKELYLPKEKRSLEYIVRNPFKYQTYKYLRLLRKYEYNCFKRDNTKNILLSKLFSTKIKLIDVKSKRLGIKLNLEISPNCVGKGIRICHPNVIINGIVGENCIFHGNNVIGNKGTGQALAIPKIASNVDIGIGAMLIGDIEVATGCVIGAGSVVTKSFTVPGSVIAGVPAKLIK